jgi:hypothetical protein
MSLRSGLLGLAGVLAAAGAAAAKPPDLPIDPHSEGREPDPVVREFYQPDPPARPHTSYYVPPARPPAEGVSVEEVVELVSGWLTIPLGLVTPAAQ